MSSRLTGVGWIALFCGADLLPSAAVRMGLPVWQLGVVSMVVAGFRPVRMLERVGEQSGLAA